VRIGLAIAVLTSPIAAPRPAPPSRARAVAWYHAEGGPHSVLSMGTAEVEVPFDTQTKTPRPGKIPHRGLTPVHASCARLQRPFGVKGSTLRSLFMRRLLR